MDKFNKDFDSLKNVVSKTGLQGSWIQENGSTKRYETEEKGILIWYEKTKTIQFQGSELPKKRLEEAYNKVSSNDHSNEETKIFIVHGHDENSIDQLENILMKGGLEPFILRNNDAKSMTIIEALEQQIYKKSSFGIVLLTPDDYGYTIKQEDEERRFRARQNVVFEMGMVMAKLGRENMVILKKGDIEIPSDIQGLIYLEYKESVKEIKLELAKRIKGSGIKIDLEKI